MTQNLRSFTQVHQWSSGLKLAIIFVVIGSSPNVHADPIGPRDLALLTNDSDPNSATVANHYADVWKIPAANITHVQWSTHLTDTSVVACAKDASCIGFVQQNSGKPYLSKLAACLFKDATCLTDVAKGLNLTNAGAKACYNDSNCQSYVVQHAADVAKSFVTCASADSSCVAGVQTFLDIYKLGTSTLSPQIQAVGIAVGAPSAMPIRFDCWAINQLISYAASPLGPFKLNGKQVVYSSDVCDVGGYLRNPTDPRSFVTNPIYNSDSHQPFTDFKVRPAMLITSKSLSGTLALIDRSARAHLSCPNGVVIAEQTCDGARNVRGSEFATLSAAFKGSVHVDVETVTNRYLNPLTGKVTSNCNYRSSLDYKPGDAATANAAYGQLGNDHSDTFRVGTTKLPSNPPLKLMQNPPPTLGYFTGTQHVPTIENPDLASTRLNLVPGAIGDTLTSFSGIINYGGNGQGYITQWIEAGFSGSSGTVVEPGPDTNKFSDPSIVMARYAKKGEPLVEAYPKSSQQPTEVLFIGDPLVSLCKEGT